MRCDESHLYYYLTFIRLFLDGQRTVSTMGLTEVNLHFDGGADADC